MAVAGAHGQDGHNEHQHAHAAYPMGKAAPEQHAPAQGLDLGQDAGAGGGKAGDRFKKGVHKIGNIPGDNKGQGTENRHQHPSQGHHGEAVPGVQVGPLRGSQAQYQADESRQQGRYQKGDCRLAVNQGHRHGQHQKGGFRQQDAADDEADHSIIQASPRLYSEMMSRISWRVVSVVTTITSSWT